MDERYNYVLNTINRLIEFRNKQHNIFNQYINWKYHPENIKYNLENNDFEEAYRLSLISNMILYQIDKSIYDIDSLDQKLKNLNI